jgi:hypothetical protein
LVQGIAGSRSGSDGAVGVLVVVVDVVVVVDAVLDVVVAGVVVVVVVVVVVAGGGVVVVVFDSGAAGAGLAADCVPHALAIMAAPRTRTSDWRNTSPR